MEAEKKVVRAAMEQARKLPYQLTLRDSQGKLADETIQNSAMRDAILAGNEVDGLVWRPTSNAQYPSLAAAELTIALHSDVEDLTEIFRL